MTSVISIGSDPEYVILEKGKVVRADAVLESCNVYDGYEIGQDCGGGEFRPKYGNTPLEHRDNLEKLILKVKENVPDHWEFLAGTRPKNFEIGGHIHIGMPIEGGVKDTRDEYINYRRFANYFSYFCCIPLRKIEKPKDILTRGLDRGHYGYFGKWDYKSFGIELRTPASWLVSRDITTSALCLAHVVANEWTINPVETINPLYDESDHPKYVALVNGDISKIIEAIEKMEEYKYYRGEIEPLLQMIANKEIWKCDEDFRTFW